MNRYVLTLLLLSLVAAGLFCGCRRSDRPDRRTVASFDPDRFMGRWYEIARFDHRFERGLQRVEARYRPLGDGRIEVLNSGTAPDGKRRTARGIARSGRRPGALRVSFFRPFYSDYNLLELGDDYDWALVGSRSPDYLWILARTPRLPDDTLRRILRLAGARGYDTDRLLFVEQEPDAVPAAHP